MTNKFVFTTAEKDEALTLYTRLKKQLTGSLQEGDEEKIRTHLMHSIEQQQVHRDVFGLNPILCGLQTALIMVEEIGLKRDAVMAILLRSSFEDGFISADEVGEQYGPSVALILRGLERIHNLYKKNPVIESENFRNLLLSFAEDMRVILIMIADRVNLMRQIRDTENQQDKLEVSQEAAYLYAPLAHKLGLYQLKSSSSDFN